MGVETLEVKVGKKIVTISLLVNVFRVIQTVLSPMLRFTGISV